MSKIIYAKEIRTKMNMQGQGQPAYRKASVLGGLLAFNVTIALAMIFNWTPDSIWKILPQAKATQVSAKAEPVLDGSVSDGKAWLRDSKGNGRPRAVTGVAATEHDDDAAKINAAAEYINKNYRIARMAADMIAAEAFKAGKRHGIDPVMMLAIIGQESRFNPISESTAGAMGLTQTLPEAHPEKLRHLGKNGHILDISDNIDLGAKIYSEYLQKFNGNTVKALQQYNGSLGDPAQGYSRKVLELHRKFKAALA